MSVEMQTKTLNLFKQSINKNVIDWIEQDIIVPDTKPDAIKIVMVLTTPYVDDVEILDKSIKVTGTVNYFIIYNVAEEMFSTRGLFVTYPYTKTFELENVDKSMDVTVVPVTKNVIYSLPNERKFSIKSEVDFSIKIKENLSLDLIREFENQDNIECKMVSNTFSNIITSKKSIIATHEEIMLPKDMDDFYEILKADPKIVNTEFKESYNKVMVKGELELDLLYLCQNSDDNMKKHIARVPFSAMVEVENITDNSKFDINYIIKEFDIKINEEITTTKTLTTRFQIEVEVVMYEDEEIEYVDDFYSATKELECDYNKHEIVTKINKLVKNIEIKENLTSILDSNANILDYYLDINALNYHINNNMMNVEGNLKVIIIFKEMDKNQIISKNIDILLNKQIDLIENIKDKNATVKFSKGMCNIIQNNMDLELKGLINVEIVFENVQKINVINSINENKLDMSVLDSINLYIVKDNDSLWSIAKKYKTSIEKILKTNKDLSEENLKKGQKLFIIR